MKYSIVMVTDGLEFTGDTLDHRAMGGSETAFICVARELAKQGHHVRAYCKCEQEGIFDGVMYFDNSRIPNFIDAGECDILIVSRFYDYLGYKFNSKLNILWNHDIIMDPNRLLSLTWNIDYMYCLSDYHKAQYGSKAKEFINITKLISNGIDQDLIVTGAEKKHKIMFTSRPERGLFKALEIYERIGDKDLEMLVCSYPSLTDGAAQQIEDVCLQYMDGLQKRGFNIAMGSFTKKDLYQHIAESKAVIYPTQFPEIFCISAVEAQANGTAFLTTNDFAMKETVGYKGIEYDEHFDENFLKSLKVIISNEIARRSIEEMGLKHVAKYTWANVAKQFVDDATAFFKERSEDSTAILKRMIYESDLVMARKAIHEAGCPVEKNELLARLDHDLRFVDGVESIKEIYEQEDTHEVIDMDVIQSEENTRFKWLSSMVAKHGVKNILDYACHMGSSSILTSNRNPDVKVTGYDLSETAIEKAKIRLEKFGKNKDNVIFTKVVPDQKFDAVFCGEMLEHVMDPVETINKLEKFVEPNGWMFLTIPKGAWENLSHEENMRKDVVYHVHGFDYWDIINMLGEKTDFGVETIKCFNGFYGEAMGNYLIRYRVDGKPTGERDLQRKLMTYRPHQTISACIIAKDAAKEIETIIDEIHFEMDEIIVGVDPATKDDTMERLKKYLKVKAEIMPHAIQGPDFWGFANARNWTLDKASSEWVLWIDTDERIIRKEPLRKYLDAQHINSYVIKQHHAQFDNFIQADVPQRLFRKSKGRFVGFIHEQPQSIHDINASIEPSLVMTDCDIVNLGEITESVRRGKALGRNLELLKRDVKENVDKRQAAGLPIRKLSIVLLMRDFFNRIVWGAEAHGDYVTKDSTELCLPKIWNLFNKYFADETDPIYRNMSESILQSAYKVMKVGAEVKIEIGGKVYDRRVDERDVDRFIFEIRTALLKQFEPPTVI